LAETSQRNNETTIQRDIGDVVSGFFRNRILFPGMIRFLIVCGLLLLPSLTSFCLQDSTVHSNIVPRFPDATQVSVVPLIFLPREVSISDDEFQSARRLLDVHVAMAREHYESLLNTTFLSSKTHTKPFQSDRFHSDFVNAPQGGDDDRAHRIVKELLRWMHEDRYSSKHIYLIIYVRPMDERFKSWEEFLGGARPFNGAPNTGGGYVEMEYPSLIRDRPYPFQSTLVHELGHAFGLAHANCKGYDQGTNMSIMSYNPLHYSRGFTKSQTPAGFNPEEYFALSLNKRVFPDFSYDESIHNPAGKTLDLVLIQQCFLSPMGAGIGDFRHFEGVGYELFFNGRRVSGPEAALYSLAQAGRNCAWNRVNNASFKIECRYNGQLIE